MDKDARIFVAGRDTLIGGAIVRQLHAQGYTNVITQVLDLCDRNSVHELFTQARPAYVFMAAGKSGGIAANQSYPADLMLDNLLSASHVISSAHAHRVQKLLYLASSCSYPRLCEQPMREDAVLTGRLEPTNEAYAVAKIAGMKLCQAYRHQHGADFVAAVPANAFGLGDDFSPNSSHVVAALIRRMHEAGLSGDSAVEVWGTGQPRREFIFADDLADACIFIMNHYHHPEPINLGSGSDVSIRELAEQVQRVVGYTGELRFDASKPDGMPVKLLDSSRLRALGWQPKTSLPDALAATYLWFIEASASDDIPVHQRSRTP